MKRIAIVAALVVIGTVMVPSRLYSVTGEAWRIITAAEMAFERRDFGEALRLAEDARQAHVSHISSAIAELSKSLLPYEVKKAGDRISDVRAVLEKRNDEGALGILDEIFLTRPPSSFNDSLTALLSWLEKRVEYPEADFLIGRIYEAEGENAVALSFYEKAWIHRDFLDIPEERFTLTYRMADLAQNSGNPGTREKYLLVVLTEDAVYGRPGEESPTLAAMIRTLATEQTVEKFFTLYRHSNFNGLKAYHDLASFYYRDSSGRLDRALPVAVLASCISITALCDALSRYDFSFTYGSFADLLTRVGRNREISAWAQTTEIWDSFSLLAAILYDHGERAQAISLWSILASHCPDRETALKAELELRIRRSPSSGS